LTGFALFLGKKAPTILKHKNILLKGVDVSIVLEKLEMSVDDINVLIDCN